MRRRRVSFSYDPRWTALKRAGLAVMAALALLAAVLWFGDSGQPPGPLSEPANVVPAQSSAPMPQPDADTPAPTPAPDVTAQTAESPAPVVEEAASAVAPEVAEPQIASPPELSNTPAKPAKKLNGAANSNNANLNNGSSKSPKTTGAPAKPVSLSDGYFVQLGVFDDTDNTDRVFDNAVALGLPARIQSRVMVGPFRNKREAEAARGRLKNVAEGVVVPPQKTAKAGENPKAKSKRRAK